VPTRPAADFNHPGIPLHTSGWKNDIRLQLTNAKLPIKIEPSGRRPETAYFDRLDPASVKLSPRCAAHVDAFSDDRWLTSMHATGRRSFDCKYNIETWSTKRIVALLEAATHRSPIRRRGVK
jgi:hypothetical protein